MPVEVIMPKVDMDMATGKLAAWHVAEGEIVTKGAPLFDIETDKAAMEVESPATGRLHHVIAAPGQTIDVGAPVAWIYAEGEAVGRGPERSARGCAAEPSPPPAPEARRRDRVAAVAERAAHGRRARDADRAAPGARRPASSSSPSPGPARAAASSARTSRSCSRRRAGGRAAAGRGARPGAEPRPPAQPPALGRRGGRALRLDPQGHRHAASC